MYDAFKGDAFQKFAFFIDRNVMSDARKRQCEEDRKQIDEYDTDFEETAQLAMLTWCSVVIAPKWLDFQYYSGTVRVFERYAEYHNNGGAYRLSEYEYDLWRRRFLG
jgi:hypothetical protein